MRYLAAIQPLWTKEESERHHEETVEYIDAGPSRESFSAIQPLKTIYREVVAEDELHATKMVRDWWGQEGTRVGSVLPRDIDVSLVPVTAHTTIRFSVIGSIAGEADIT